MEFDQLMECNMRNILFEKSYAKCGRETSPRPFSEKRKLSISLDKQSKTLYCLFLLYDKLRAISKLHTTWFYLVLNFFKKEGLELFSLPHFLHNFGKKKILLCSINLSNFIVWLPLLCKIWGNMCIAIVYEPGYDAINFEVNLIFLIKPFFRMTKMS